MLEWGKIVQKLIASLVEHPSALDDCSSCSVRWTHEMLFFFFFVQLCVVSVLLMLSSFYGSFHLLQSLSLGCLYRLEEHK